MWAYPHNYPQKPQPYPQNVDKACFIGILLLYFQELIIYFT